MANESQITLKMSGVQDVDRALSIIPKRMNKKVLLSTYRKAGAITVKEARSRAPKKSGRVKRSIGIVTWKNTEGNEATVRIGPRRKAGNKNMSGWHSHMIEFGTKSRSPIKGKKLVFEKEGKLIFVDSVAGMKAQPFMKPAIEATKEKVKENIRIELGTTLEKELRKQLAKLGK